MATTIEMKGLEAPPDYLQEYFDSTLRLIETQKKQINNEKTELAFWEIAQEATYDTLLSIPTTRKANELRNSLTVLEQRHTNSCSKLNEYRTQLDIYNARQQRNPNGLVLQRREFNAAGRKNPNFLPERTLLNDDGRLRIAFKNVPIAVRNLEDLPITGTSCFVPLVALEANFKSPDPRFNATGIRDHYTPSYCINDNRIEALFETISEANWSKLISDVWEWLQDPKHCSWTPADFLNHLTHCRNIHGTINRSPLNAYRYAVRTGFTKDVSLVQNTETPHLWTLTTNEGVTVFDTVELTHRGDHA
jgi:hypothetical protein